MKYIVTGRESSGKSSFVQEAKPLVARKNDITLVEVKLESILQHYREGDSIIYIETPALLCMLRQKKAHLNLNRLEQEDKLLSYVTDLPNCFIIKNDLSPDEFKVRIKQLVKRL